MQYPTSVTHPGELNALSVYYQNVRGINTKVNEIYNNSAACNNDVIVFTETWLSDSVLNSEIFSINFVAFRCDRRFDLVGATRGGGVVLALRRNLSVVRVDTSMFDYLIYVDMVGVKVIINEIIFYIFAIYIPPNATVQMYESLFETFLSLPYFLSNKVLLIGDFNIPDFICHLNASASTGKINLINNFMNFANLDQINSIKNAYGRLLDLALTNNLNGFTERAIDVLTAEDNHHPAIVLSLEIRLASKNNRQKNNLNFYNFKRTNLVNLYQNLSYINWNTITECTDVNTACERFYEIIYNTLDIHVPKTQKRNKTYPPWFTGQIIQNIKLKYKWWKKYKKTNNPLDLETFKNMRRDTKNDIKDSYKIYCSRIENGIKSDPKKFWRFINDKKSNHTLPTTMSYDDTVIQEPQIIADSFASFFQSSYVASSQKGNNDNDLYPSQSPVDINKIPEQVVTTALKQLKPKATVGADRIPAFVLKDCAIVFACPLTFLFNLSLQTSTFPDLWKTSRITPVFKKGDSSNILNYRPISIINNFSKVFEIILHEYLYNSISIHISARQHGFMKGRSTVSNLFYLTQDLAESLDAGEQTDVIYTDCSKAFDRLDHGILLDKLTTFGLSQKLLLFFMSYLTNRVQFVQCHGHNSKEFIATSGVPQGSHLGPLLFIIFLNDLVSILDVDVLIYADDVKLYLRIGDDRDCRRLQDNFERMNEWCERNKLLLNVSKCSIVTFTRRVQPIMYDYSINGEMLKRCDSVCDLGVVLDSKLSFRDHISKIGGECFKLLGFIIRNAGDFTSCDTLKLLFNSFVRSRLEYSSVIWCPFYQTHIDSLEKIQRRFLKYTSFKLDGFYPEIGYPHDNLLTRFSMESLETRRTRSQIVFLHNILSGRIDAGNALQLLHFQVPRPTSRNHRTFALPTPRTNALKFSPLHQICDKYNKIQDQLDIHTCTVASIKRLVL